MMARDYVSTMNDVAVRIKKNIFANITNYALGTIHFYPIYQNIYLKTSISVISQYILFFK